EAHRIRHPRGDFGTTPVRHLPRQPEQIGGSGDLQRRLERRCRHHDPGEPRRRCRRDRRQTERAAGHHWNRAGEAELRTGGGRHDGGGTRRNGGDQGEEHEGRDRLGNHAVSPADVRKLPASRKSHQRMIVMSSISAHDEAMARNLDTDLLRTFVTVAETGSMTVAANALHLTQGAVSQQVKRLEETLGCALFTRARSGLRLTSAGERLIGKARRLLLLNDEILAEMSDKAIMGHVRLGVPYDLVGTTLAPAIKSYAEAWPQVEMSLVCASSPELAEKLATGEIDLAVIEEPVGANTAGECLVIARLVWSGARGGTAHLKRPLPISMVADTCAFRPAV